MDGGLDRVIAIANGKGGVGKTSVSTHLAGLTAAAGWRVLLVDLDPQGNAGEDLGYTGAGLSDEGRGLVTAVMSQGATSPHVLRDVRPGLDVIPGGAQLDSLADVLDGARRRGGSEASRILAQVLAPAAGGYALVVLDCPPRHEVLQEAALVAARHLVIPTKTDAASRKGLREMARRFTAARGLNPALTLLGVVLFGVQTSATRVRQTVRELLEVELQGSAPVFASTIRHVEAAAYDVRDRGQLAHELERDVLAAGPWWAQLRDGGNAPRLAASASSLAGDYAALTQEVLGAVTGSEADTAGATA